MLLERKVRDAYWVLSYLTHVGTAVPAVMIQKEMFKKSLMEVSRICNPLLQAGLLEKCAGHRTVYRLARPATEISLRSIYQAFDPDNHQEMSSIILFIDRILTGKTLQDLVEYEKNELEGLLLTLSL